MEKIYCVKIITVLFYSWMSCKVALYYGRAERQKTWWDESCAVDVIIYDDDGDAFFPLSFCQSCCRGFCYIRIDDDACAKTQSFSANDRTQYTNDLNLVPNQYFALQAQRRLRWIQCKIDVIFSIKTIYMQNSIKQKKRNPCQTFGMLKDC